MPPGKSVEYKYFLYYLAKNPSYTYKERKLL
jgi:hypothetical protein